MTSKKQWQFITRVSDLHSLCEPISPYSVYCTPPFSVYSWVFNTLVCFHLQCLYLLLLVPFWKLWPNAPLRFIVASTDVRFPLYESVSFLLFSLHTPYFILMALSCSTPRIMVMAMCLFFLLHPTHFSTAQVSKLHQSIFRILHCQFSISRE